MSKIQKIRCFVFLGECFEWRKWWALKMTDWKFSKKINKWKMLIDRLILKTKKKHENQRTNDRREKWTTYSFPFDWMTIAKEMLSMIDIIIVDRCCWFSCKKIRISWHFSSFLFYLIVSVICGAVHRHFILRINETTWISYRTLFLYKLR